MIWPVGPQNAVYGNGWGRLKVTLTVWRRPSRSSMTFGNVPVVTAAVAGSVAYSQLKTTSSAVKGFPSCHWTFRLSFQVTDVPSLATPPFATRRDLGGQVREEVAVGVERRERLVEDPRAVLVLGAVREVGVQEGRRLPPQDLERAAAAPLGRRERGLGLRLGHASGRQHLGGERSREAQADHHLREVAAGDGAVLHPLDPVPELALLHASVLPNLGIRMWSARFGRDWPAPTRGRGSRTWPDLMPGPGGGQANPGLRRRSPAPSVRAPGGWPATRDPGRRPLTVSFGTPARTARSGGAGPAAGHASPRAGRGPSPRPSGSCSTRRAAGTES